MIHVIIIISKQFIIFSKIRGLFLVIKWSFKTIRDCNKFNEVLPLKQKEYF